MASKSSRACAWAIAEVEVSGILISIPGGIEVGHRYARRLPRGVGLIAVRCTRLNRRLRSVATQSLCAVAHRLFVMRIKVD